MERADAEKSDGGGAPSSVDCSRCRRTSATSFPSPPYSWIEPQLGSVGLGFEPNS